ncbi:hypothetical protein C7N43_18375 [Sphingobacteriales bacterium UPWRP_1]|nr:hypothetical protein BVG80_03155 [Sphingobacteriales bacterium TSM_CSM]PSJ75536.1 hypothetical protein C7N43_18375 [Sphingobacteriales bacterium UPWRP_1]
MASIKGKQITAIYLTAFFVNAPKRGALRFHLPKFWAERVWYGVNFTKNKKFFCASCFFGNFFSFLLKFLRLHNKKHALRQKQAPHQTICPTFSHQPKHSSVYDVTAP